MKDRGRIFTRYVAPVLGAGAIGVCPLCWLGSASLLSYLGLAALIPFWRWIAFGFLALAGVGFVFDYRAHRDHRPLALLIAGTALLYVGRYVYGGPRFGGWPIWGLGAISIMAATIFNKRLFRKPKDQHPETSPQPLQDHSRNPN